MSEQVPTVIVASINSTNRPSPHNFLLTATLNGSNLKNCAKSVLLLTVSKTSRNIRFLSTSDGIGLTTTKLILTIQELDGTVLPVSLKLKITLMPIGDKEP